MGSTEEESATAWRAGKGRNAQCAQMNAPWLTVTRGGIAWKDSVFAGQDGREITAT